LEFLGLNKEKLLKAREENQRGHQEQCTRVLQKEEQGKE